MTSRGSARSARTVGEVDNYLVCRLFSVNAERGLFERAEVRLVQGLLRFAERIKPREAHPDASSIRPENYVCIN